MQDPYVYPGTAVLRNMLGITDGLALAQREGELVFARTLQLHKRAIKGRFDLAHFRAIHRHLFQDVYSWAGEIRTVAISKGNTLFALPQYVEPYSDQLFAQLTDEGQLKGLGHDEFARRAAYYLGEINALHPFREGNGRTQREFIAQLAREAGYVLDWTQVERKVMIAASIQSAIGDSTLFEVMLRAISTPLA